MWLDELKDLELPELVSGKHEAGSQKLCLMELIAFMEREPHSDSPKCVCPTLQFWGIVLNDCAPSNEYRQRLLRLAPMCVGSVTEDPGHIMGRVQERFSSKYEYEMWLDRRMIGGRMHETLTWPGEMRAQQMERFARWVHGDRRSYHDRDFRYHRDGPEHPYHTARHAAQTVGEVMRSGSANQVIEIWLMALGVFESAIIAGPHTPELKGWTEPKEVKRAKQWVEEFALA